MTTESLTAEQLRSFRQGLVLLDAPEAGNGYYGWQGTAGETYNLRLAGLIDDRAERVKVREGFGKYPTACVLTSAGRRLANQMKS
jgi:hypothetical protein